MLNSIKANNFKAWKNLDAPLGKVTGLFGTNSSGKSSLLQFLLMLKQTKNAADRGLVLDFGGSDQLVNLGNFRDVVHRHDIEQSIDWTLNWELPETLKIGNPMEKRTSTLFEGAELETSVSVSLKRSSPSVDALTYRFSGQDFELVRKVDGGTEYTLKPGPKDSGDFSFIRTPGRAWTVPGPVKTHLFPDQAKTYFQNADFLGDFEAAYEKQMDSIFYLGPLREFPRREYMWAGARPLDVGARGERVVDALLAATLHEETRSLGHKKRRRKFQEIIAYWLREIGLIDEFSIDELSAGSNIYRATVRRDRYSATALLTDVGFGVSQVLPALVLLYYVPEGSTVILEQPEIHLHPAVQSSLADVIMTVARTRNVQVIVESHSEHMLRRFQRRVAEEEYDSKEIKLYFVDQDRGEARLNDLNLNMFGEIENWPKDFFGDEFAELAAIRTAALAKKIEAKKADV